jgi:hypothetical protein
MKRWIGLKELNRPFEVIYKTIESRCRLFKPRGKGVGGSETRRKKIHQMKIHQMKIKLT